jgi:low temperature requirement protein LtrA
VRHSVAAPPDAAHLPERFGLFTLILLGESVVAVMQGIESQSDWTPAAAASAFLGMAIAFVMWSWYFDGAAGAAEQPVHTRRDAIRFHLWSYAHFPLALGIVVTGVGIQRIVTAASRATLTPPEAVILTGGLAAVMLAMIAIDATSATHRGRTIGATTVSLLLVAATLALGLAGGLTSPVVIVVTMAILCVGQLRLALQRQPAQRRSRWTRLIPAD